MVGPQTIDIGLTRHNGQSDLIVSYIAIRVYYMECMVNTLHQTNLMFMKLICSFNRRR